LVPHGGERATADVTVFGASGQTVLPRLINAHRHFYQTLTRAGPVALGRALFRRLQADLALFALDELRFSGALDPVAAVVVCGAHRADRVMVGGNLVVEGGVIPGTGHGGPASATQCGCEGAARGIGDDQSWLTMIW